MVRKFLLLPVIWLLLVSIGFADGGEIYLPIITKSGDCMGSNAILEVTDGTPGGTIDLLQIAIDISVDGWNPSAPPILPAMQSSPLTSGSEVSSYKFGNAIENIGFKVGSEDSGNTQDTVIEMVQDFRRILIQGINYQVVDWHNSIVYIRARASCETNIRYAVVKTYTLPEDEDPNGPVFVRNTLMDAMTVAIERGDWLGAVPGEGECQPVSSQKDWTFAQEWEDITAAAGTNSVAFVERTDGALLSAESGREINISNDDGDTWAILYTFVVNSGITRLFKAKNDNIIAVVIDTGVPTASIWYSTNDGVAFTQDLTDVALINSSQIIELDNGDLIVGGITKTFISTNGGTSWSVLAAGLDFEFNSMIRLADNNILAGAARFSGNDYVTVKSTDGGTTWNVTFSNASNDNIDHLGLLDNGDVLLPVEYVAGGNIFVNIYRSSDNGITWTLNTSFGDISDRGAPGPVLETSTGDIYITIGNAISIADTAIWRSTDGAATWFKEFVIAGGNPRLDGDAIEIANGYVFYGGIGTIYRKVTGSNTELLGASDSDCDGIVYLSNKENISNLTHVKIDDGGAFTDIFPIAAFPQDLLPAVPIVNDAVYFGTDTTVVDSGPFSSLVFDLSSTITFTVSYLITWEYWDGAAWSMLTVTDNTMAAGGESFGALGVNSVHWENPSDWVTTAVDGDTGYWVRARVSANAGAMTPPAQQNRDIYSIINSFFEIDDADIGGDIPALAEFRIKSQSDSGGKDLEKTSGTHTGANNQAILTDAAADFEADGIRVGWYVINSTDGSQAIITAFDATTITGTLDGGTDDDWDTNDAYVVISGPDLWSNRVYTGLRSLSRGDNFRAFINISDEQNVPGITVTAGTNATFGNDPTTPTGRRLTYGALAGDTTFVDRAIITMSSDVVRDYYGKFHVFIRGSQISGSAGDITLRIQVRTGSGGITFTTTEQTFSGTNDWELLDFDAFTIPAGGRVITPSELGDTGVIAIQAKNDSASGRDVYIYDMVLIPTDEWAGDFTDLADIDDSIIGQQDNVKHFIDIDSVRNPKVLGRSLVRLDDSNESISANYEFDTNGEVILQANADQRVWAISAYIGSNDEWISEPWLGWSVQVFKNQRYLTQRGSR